MLGNVKVSQFGCSVERLQAQCASEFHVPGRAAVRHGKFLGAGVAHTWGLHEQYIAKIHSSRSGMKNNRDQALLANQKSRYIKDILYAYWLGLEEKCSRLAHFCTDITRRALQCIVSRFSEV